FAARQRGAEAAVISYGNSILKWEGACSRRGHENQSIFIGWSSLWPSPASCLPQVSFLALPDVKPQAQKIPQALRTLCGTGAVFTSINAS
ncbi:hypothetical protein, partial [Pseudomonas lijiangensis]|uniref:hypothetical protein n=1 Tax=Pseudomonas lijiangensis TaxID=2995658 RepID=UPI001C8A64B2